MFERFTERARQVIVLAQQEARGLQHNYIGTEHLLLGLVREEDGAAARALRNCGVTAESVAHALATIAGQGAGAPEGQIPFTPRCRKVLELSLREALSLGHNYIGTEHILLGLLRENEGVGARILLDAQVNSDDIHVEIMRQLSGGRPSRPRQSAAIEQTSSPDRIGPVLRVVEEYWRAHPGLRLGQLLADLANGVGVDVRELDDGALLDAIWKTQP